MLNEVRQRVTTCPGTGQVVTTPGASLTCMSGHRDARNVLYHMHYNYTWVLWNIQRILQHIQNIHFDTLNEFGQLGPAS